MAARTTAALLCALALTLGGPAAAAAQEEPTGIERWPKAARPQAPVMRQGACPFECCRYGRWIVSQPTVVRRRPTGTAPVAFRLAAGARVLADTGFVRVDTIGLVVLREPYLDRMNDIPYVAGDSLLVLDYIGEGVYNGWLRGRAVQTEVFWLGEGPGVARVVRHPSMQWWVRVRDRRGRTGWVDMATTAVDGNYGCG
jgi:hypothetical protein